MWRLCRRFTVTLLSRGEGVPNGAGEGAERVTKFEWVGWAFSPTASGGRCSLTWKESSVGKSYYMYFSKFIPENICKIMHFLKK